MDEKEKEKLLKKIEEYTKKIKEEPNNAIYYYNRGNTYYSLKEYEKAINDYNTAIESNSNNASYYNNRGISFNSLKEYEKAINDYNKAIELNPSYALAYNNRGVSFYNLKKYGKAIISYSRAIKLDPDYSSPYYNKGLVYKTFKKYEKAIKNYNKAIELNPNNSSYYNSRGNALNSSEKYEEAIEDYNKAIELNPNNSSYYNSRGNALNSSEKYEEAIEDYNKAIELNPNNSSYYNSRGNALNNSGKYEEAIEDYNRAIALNSNYDYYYYNKALAYYHYQKKNNNTKNFNEIIKNLNKALELNPNNNSAKKLKKNVSELKENEKFKESSQQDNNKIVDISKNIENLEETSKEDYLEPNFISDFNEVKALYLNGIFKETKKKLNLFTEKYKEDSKKEKQIKILLKEVESIRKFLESGQEVLKGYLTFADILGWKGIWKKQNSEEEKVDTLNTLLFIKSKLEEEFKDEKENYKINLISDTYVVFAKNFQINNKLSKRLIELCLKNDLLIRGATSYGKFYNNDMVYIGQTVDEAASWHEMGEEIGIFYTSSAKLSIDEENPIEYELKNSYLRKGTIKTKLGEIKTYYINWYNKETKKDFYRIMKDEVISPDISSKYLNTEKSMEKHLNVKSNKILRSNKYVKNR